MKHLYSQYEIENIPTEKWTIRTMSIFFQSRKAYHGLQTDKKLSELNLIESQGST